MSENKGLSAKRYLEQLEILDERINQKQIQLDDLKQRSVSTGGIDYGERVQTSPSGDLLCRAVTSYISLEEEINADIDRFVNTKNMIINQIQGLGNVNYIKLLFLMYVQYKDLRSASTEMNYSYQYTKELHGAALQEFQSTYPNLLRSVLN